MRAVVLHRRGAAAGEVVVGGVDVEDDVPRCRLLGCLRLLPVGLLEVERLLSPRQQSGGDGAAGVQVQVGAELGELLRAAG